MGDISTMDCWLCGLALQHNNHVVKCKQTWSYSLQHVTFPQHLIAVKHCGVHGKHPIAKLRILRIIATILRYIDYSSDPRRYVTMIIFHRFSIASGTIRAGIVHPPSSYTVRVDQYLFCFFLNLILSIWSFAVNDIVYTFSLPFSYLSLLSLKICGLGVKDQWLTQNEMQLIICFTMSFVQLSRDVYIWLVHL